MQSRLKIQGVGVFRLCFFLEKDQNPLSIKKKFKGDACLCNLQMALSSLFNLFCIFLYQAKKKAIYKLKGEELLDFNLKSVF